MTRARRRLSTCSSRSASLPSSWRSAPSFALGRTGGSSDLPARRHPTRWAARRATLCSMPCCFRGRLQGGDEGQATVEAALLLPVLMVLMAMLVQPACLLYTRCVMQSAAAEACRLVATSTRSESGVPAAQRAFVLRRLAAVPNSPIFHEGGEQGWDIELQGSTEGHEAFARIATTVHPLPFVGALAGLVGQAGASGSVRLEVSVSRTTRPEWLEGGYDDWVSIWDD